MDDTTQASTRRSNPDSGRWTLVIVGAGGLHTQALPSEGELVLGRDDTCDVVLTHPRISRRHARLRLGSSLSIEDLGSRNRTTVRGIPLEANTPHPLGSGESFSLGPFSLLVIPESPAAAPPPSSAIVVEDPAAQKPSTVLVAVARSPVRVLITGETGVGKELLAEAIHRLSGRTGRFVRLNCATFSETLLESELFGHERGAFTGAAQAKAGLLEVAAGGTMFLDEVGELPLSLQAKLLRALESQEILRVGGTQPIKIDVRFVVATNRDLPAEIARGAFRMDLYYRLAGLSLTIPPLAARNARIVPLAEELLRAAAANAGIVPPRLGHAAVTRLQTHSWPGNVRELRNVIERALVLSLGATEILPEHILLDAVATSAPAAASSPAGGSAAAAVSSAPVAADGGASGPHSATPQSSATAPSGSDASERQRILDALEQCAGNQTRAAKLLGISRATLATKLLVHRIPRPRS